MRFMMTSVWSNATVSMQQLIDSVSCYVAAWGGFL